MELIPTVNSPIDFLLSLQRLVLSSVFIIAKKDSRLTTKLFIKQIAQPPFAVRIAYSVVIILPLILHTL